MAGRTSLWRNRGTGANVIWRSGNSATPQAVTQSQPGVGRGRCQRFRRRWKIGHPVAQQQHGANTVWRSGNSATAQVRRHLPAKWVTVGAGRLQRRRKVGHPVAQFSTGANVIWLIRQFLHTAAVTPVASQAWPSSVSATSTATTGRTSCGATAYRCEHIWRSGSSPGAGGNVGSQPGVEGRRRRRFQRRQPGGHPVAQLSDGRERNLEVRQFGHAAGG